MSELPTHLDKVIWLEITNGCNLQCNHCYSDSSPGSHVRDRLSSDDYLRLIAEAAAIGYKRIQFIGGEPLLNKHLPQFIDEASRQGFTTIELFSNLTLLPDEAKRSIVQHGVDVSTSVYSHQDSVHDSIVGKAGSFSSTLGNVQQLADCNVNVRAGFVEMEQNSGHFPSVRAMLESRGLGSISHDRIRAFGRAGDQAPDMAHLCGTCAGSTACVSSDGQVFPCIMSRAWPIGSVVDKPLAEVLSSEHSNRIRDRIRLATHRGQPLEENCGPQGICGPTGYNPCGPQGNCGPNGKHCLPDNPKPNPWTKVHVATHRL